MDLIDVKSKLAKRLLDGLSDPNTHFSLADDSTTFRTEEYLNKIKHYIQWIKQTNVHSVMILSRPSIDTFCLCYALVLSNKTYIPIHTSTSAELLKTYLQTYQVDLLLVQPQLMDRLDFELKSRLIEDKNRGFFYGETRRQEQTFCLMPGIVLFTSGTSEQPKAVYYPYNTLHHYLSWCSDEFKLNKEDNFLFTTELSFVASLRPLFVPALAAAHITFIGNASTNKLQLIINALTKHKITVLNLTPTLFKILVQHIERGALHHLLLPIRLVFLSGEPIDIVDINYWFAHIKADTVFYNLYGATEYLVPFYKKINAPLQKQDRLHLGQLRASCDYQLLPHPEGYELCIAGDISTAYFDEKLTQTNYITINNRCFIKTNDIVQIRNKELFFCYRAQRIFKKYGQLVNLDQIEYILKKYQNGFDFITFTDEKNENKIFLMIGGSIHDEQLLKQIKTHLKKYLPSYMHPDEYIFTPHVPLTSSDKIDYFSIKKTLTHSESNKLFTYFEPFFHDKKIEPNTRIITLGLESIDYIELTNKLLQITGKWLDVSKINNTTRIKDIESCLVDFNAEKPSFNEKVALNPLQNDYFSWEQNHQEQPWTYMITFFCLKEDINIRRLENAISKTIANHFMLASKLEVIDNDYFYVPTDVVSSDFKFRVPVFFPKKTLAKLQISLHSDKLMKIYIQKKKGRYFLIMAYHHIIMDGWSAMLVREEIFRRYQGTQKISSLSRADEIKYLNQASQFWPNKNHDAHELKLRLEHVNPHEYNHLDSLFNGALKKRNTYFILEKDKVDRFANKNQIQKFPYSIIFTLLLHEIISHTAGVNKLFFYTSFSNRNLPILKIKELIINLATALPIFFDNTNLTHKEFASQIQKDLVIYFKNMNYGGIIEIWNSDIFTKNILSTLEQPYLIVFTYINKIIDDEYIQNNYIDWPKSMNEMIVKKKGIIFLRVYNMGAQFIVILDSYMNKNIHDNLANHLTKLVS